MEMDLGYFEQIIAGNPGVDPKKLFMEMCNRVEFYRTQAARYMNDPEARLGVVQEFQKMIDKSLSDKPPHVKSLIKCKKGCAHCCKIRVFVTLSEALYVYAFCKHFKIPINEDYLRRQAELKEDGDYNFSEVRNCMFLDTDNTCKIYEARPFGCRRYLVTSDPKNCDVQSGSKQISSLAVIDEDMMIAGMMAADKELGSFPEMMLRAIELDK